VKIVLLSVLIFGVLQTSASASTINEQGPCNYSQVDELAEVLSLDLRLLKAIKGHDYKRVKKLLRKGANPNTIDTGRSGKRSKPAIFFALESYDLELLKILIANGADVNLRKNNVTIKNNTLLMVAFRKLGRTELNSDMSKKMKSIISTLIVGSFEYENRTVSFKINPYAKGGMDANKDVVSFIFNNSRSGNGLKFLYSLEGLDQSKFVHRNRFLSRGAVLGKLSFMNVYLDENEARITSANKDKAIKNLNNYLTNHPERKDEVEKLILRLER